MLSRTSSTTTPGRARIALAALVATSVMAALLLGGLVAQAQSDRGAVPNLRLSSASPGELTISWDAPDPAPSDYRVIWAKQDLGFLSYRLSNEANRGNEYPGGNATSITLTGLTKGETFKVLVRARYTSGGNNGGPWSGPWTATATARVQEDPPPEPQPTPASTPQPPAAPTGLTASQVAHDSVTISWTAPSRGTVTGYRVLRGTDANSLSAIAQDTENATAEYTDSTVAAETAYHYAVLALSQDVDGAQSTTVSVTTRAAPEPKKGADKPPTDRVTRAAPGVPLNLTAVSGASQLTYTWDPPASDGGSAIVRYNYEFGPTGGTLADGNHGTNPTGSQSLIKTGLTNGTAYTFKVRAVTNFGGTTTVGVYTAVVTATPGMPRAPARPIVAPVPRTTDSLTVNWTAPENTGRPTITSYDVRHSSDFGDTWTDGPQDVSGGPVTLAGLGLGTFGGLYLVQVRATNTAGDGPWSESAKEALFPLEEEVAADLGLVPAGVRNGDRFRFLFITHDAHTAESDQGASFDDSVDNAVGDSRDRWHFLRESDSVSLDQRALVSTPGVDARVRTDTTFTAGDKGVPIYWLRGSKVADDYEDFYDGSWDDVTSPRNSRGAVVTVTAQPWTGSANDGTELFAGTVSLALGRTRVGIAGLGSTTAGHGPLSGGDVAATGMLRPLFGLSPVYVVRDDHFLLSNMAQTGESNDRREGRRSQRFTTGSNPGGYALDSVTFSSLSTVSSTNVAFENWSVAIYTVDASGHPATEHAALTAPDDYVLGKNVFTAPAGTTLSADTTYAVVVTAGTTPVFMDGAITYAATTDLKLEVTTSNSENERSASRWSIFDAFDIESGSSWSADTDGKALYIAVRGAPVPDKPTGLSATPSGSDRISLSWTAPADNGGSAVTGYRIEVSDDGSTGWTDVVADTGFITTTYTHTGLSVGDTRHYRVSAINVNGTGPASDTAMATITRAATGVPAITAANAFRVPGVLTANKGTIADTDGLPLESTFTWQWVQVDGMTETDIVSATSQTYTLTDADVGKKIKVKASFTDTGTTPNAEGPLTSVAYPSTGSVTAASTCNAPASYPGGATQIWTGEVTVGQIHFTGSVAAVRGFSSANINLGFASLLSSVAAGALSNTMFNAGSQYTVKLAGVSTGTTFLGTGRLYFATTSSIPAAVRTQLTLYACDQAFPFSTGAALGEAWRWTSPGLDWTDKVDRTLYITRDQTAPTVASVAFTGTTLTLTFNEDLGPAASLANSAFTVKKTTSGGTETTVTLSGAPTISGKTVVLTMGAAPAATDSVTVTYTKPTTGAANKLVDRFSNEVATFTQVTGVPGAPTGLSATASGATSIDLSWTAPANNGGRVISGYKIEWSAAGSAPWTVLVATTGSTATTYSNTGLSSGTTRHYRVSAINSDGAGAVSNTANATTLTRANNRPTSRSGTVTATEDTVFTFSASNFAFSDSDAGDTLASVKITELPAAGKGALALDGATITSSALPKTVTKADLDADKLKYSPPANANGSRYASFKFKVNDGFQDSASAYTMTINVTPVNDAATGTPAITGSSKVGNTLTASTSGITDPDGLPNSFTYQWKRFASDGTAFEANIGTNSSTYILTISEEGKKVKVEVSFTDNGSTREGPLVSSAFPSRGTVTVPTSDSLNVGALGAYWNGADADGNLLEVEVCSGAERFQVIWAGPGDNRRADQWEAEITTKRGAGRVIHSFSRAPTLPELTGRVFLAGPGSIRVRVRGQFGSTWGTWSPKATLHCIESISLYGGADVGSTLIVDWRRPQAGQQTITWKRTDDRGNTTVSKTETLGANDRSRTYTLTAADAGKRISATIASTVDGVAQDRNSPSSSHVVPRIKKLVGRAIGPSLTDEDGAFEYVASDTEHQAVETGSHRAGYTLDYVQIRLSSTTDANPAVQRLSLWSSRAASDINDRTPSRQLVEFPRVLKFVVYEPNNTRATFNAPAAVKLNPSTTYHIRNLKVSEAAGACELTDQSELDGNGLSGWNMATRVRQGGPNYSAGSETRSCRMSLWGTEVASSAPQVTGIRVSSRATGGVYRTGDTIEITATLSAPVRGSLSFPIHIGGTSHTLYANNSAPSRNFVFSYTVQSGDYEKDGIRYWAQTLRGNVAAYLHHPSGRFFDAKVNQP